MASFGTAFLGKNGGRGKVETSPISSDLLNVAIQSAKNQEGYQQQALKLAQDQFDLTRPILSAFGDVAPGAIRAYGDTYSKYNDTYGRYNTLYRNEYEPAFRKAAAVRNTLGDQILEALRTGGVGAGIPIINKAVEDSRLATSNTMRQLDENLAFTKLGATPYGVRARGDTLLSGELATGRIPTEYAKGFIALAPNYNPVQLAEPGQPGAPNFFGGSPGAGYLGPGASLVGSAIQSATSNANAGLNASTGLDIARGQVNASQYNAELAAFTQLWSSIFSAAGTAKACWIAAVIFGRGTPKFIYSRYWIMQRWQGPLAVCVRWTYLRIGERLARSRRICRWLTPLFERAARYGERTIHAA